MHPLALSSPGVKEDLTQVVSITQNIEIFQTIHLHFYIYLIQSIYKDQGCVTVCFGFTGIYVERVGDSPTENTYTGLLGVGDEILEVNGEIIAGLTLDQVTRLMTRESKAKIRIRPNSWIKH